MAWEPQSFKPQFMDMLIGSQAECLPSSTIGEVQPAKDALRTPGSPRSSPKQVLEETSRSKSTTDPSATLATNYKFIPSQETVVKNPFFFNNIGTFSSRSTSIPFIGNDNASDTSSATLSVDLEPVDAISPVKVNDHLAHSMETSGGDSEASIPMMGEFSSLPLMVSTSAATSETTADSREMSMVTRITESSLPNKSNPPSETESNSPMESNPSTAMESNSPVESKAPSAIVAEEVNESPVAARPELVETESSQVVFPKPLDTKTFIEVKKAETVVYQETRPTLLFRISDPINSEPPKPKEEVVTKASESLSAPKTEDSEPTMEQSGNIRFSLCIRLGCVNLAVESPAWDNEYCSSECAIKHCKDVFDEWVRKRHNEAEA